MEKIKRLFTSPVFLLGLIILSAFMVRIYNINYNSIFLDEALYITVGKEILKGNIDEGINGISWIGGFPFFYPVISGIFYSLSGILFARFFNVLLGTLSIYLIYLFTKQLPLFQEESNRKKAGLVAASFMACAAVAITASRLAIYDGLSFTLFLSALVVLVKAIYTGERRYYVVTSLILFLSFLAKYTVAMFFPFLLLLPFILAVKTKSKEAVLGIVFYFWLPLVSAMSLYGIKFFTELKTFLLDQQVLESTSYYDVVSIFWEYSSVSYLLFLLGAILLGKSYKVITGLLLFYSFIPIATHLLSGNTSSIGQHTFLSLIFLFPVIGAFFVIILKSYRIIGVLILFAALGLNLFYSISQVNRAESFWPNSTKAIAYLRNNISPNDRILAEADDIVSLGLEEEISADQITGPFEFTYNGLEGMTAYNKAIEDGYFRFVQLEGTYFLPEQMKDIEKELSERYVKVYDDNSIMIYQIRR